jgi:phosphoribosylaminoimidazole-succinocarboxamide synthase
MMPYKCCVVGCNTGKTQQDEENEENVAVFVFPDQETHVDEWKAWGKFVNRKNFLVTKSARIFEKHQASSIKDEYIRKGNQRNTLIRDLKPIPCIQHYSDSTPPSVLPTPSPPTLTNQGYGRRG